MNKVLVIICIIFGILSFTVNNIIAIPMSLNFGLTKEIDSCNEYWPIGYTFGANIFYPMRENILIGGRLSYHRWHRKSARYDLNCQLHSTSSPQLFEICPTMRIVNPFSKGSFVNVLVQLGAGYGIYDIEVNESYYSHVKNSYFDKDEIAPIIYIGMGIMFTNPQGLSFEIYPEIKVLHTQNNFIQLYSINFGIGFTPR